MCYRMCVFILCFFGCAASLRAVENMSLQQAVDRRLVKVVVKSLGGYQGWCISMELKNLGGKPINVLVEAGRRLNSLDDPLQDILVTREQLIALREYEHRSFSVKGYCCQASGRSPSAGAVYSVNKLADSNLVKLARYLNAHEAAPAAEQFAVWAISDGMPSANIASEQDSSLLELKRLVCDLKGEVMPWYSIFAKTMVFSSGAMQVYPVSLHGQLEFSNDAYSYTTLHVLNEAGVEVSYILQQWTAPGAQKYALNFPVKGLAKGKYRIELRNAQKQLALKEFEI